ncbi:hypothetical protein [Rahnella sp. Larv3_ips]|uniref:hypothetical protein n=1 Tax=Rahnella sp. Larv3_ips TaxID=1896943 RepID=UPI00138F6190|nr:hypothetical protein [Rahnella sp. Larv3_ips]
MKTDRNNLLNLALPGKELSVNIMIILHYFKEVAEFYAQEMTEIFHGQQETVRRRKQAAVSSEGAA